MGKYPCGSFFAQAYDSQDRENLLSGEGADIYISKIVCVQQPKDQLVNLDGKQVQVDVLRIDFNITPPFHWNAKNQKIC